VNFTNQKRRDPYAVKNHCRRRCCCLYCWLQRLGRSSVPLTVPGSSHVKDALRDTIPPAPPVLCSLFNLVPADAIFLRSFLTTSFQFCRCPPGLLKPVLRIGVQCPRMILIIDSTRSFLSASEWSLAAEVMNCRQ